MVGLSWKREVIGLKQRGGKDSVEVDGLRKSLNPGTLGFLTTKELEPYTGLIGQKKALDAVALGLDLRYDNFNIFAIGPMGGGKLTAVANLLAETTPKWDVPSDWVYVNNFVLPHKPQAIELPAGQGPKFHRMMIAVIDELRLGLPALFQSDEYVTRRRSIDLAFENNQEDAIENLIEHAFTKNVIILRTPSGFTMVPHENGEALEPEEFQKKAVGERRVIEAKIQDLERQLGDLFEKFPMEQKARAEKLMGLNEEVAKNAVITALKTIRKQFKSHEEIPSYLDAVETDLIRHVGLFLGEEVSDVLVKGYVETEDDQQFSRYMVNVLVSHDRETANGAPVIKEVNPTLSNLVGKVEMLSESGGGSTDFNLIKAGALHQANGGVLLLDANKLLRNSSAWEGLKRALLAKQINIESPIDDGAVMRPLSLSPQAIPLNVKVVLFGERELYHELKDLDPEFSSIFKIQAEFETVIPRTKEFEKDYARIIAAILKKHKLNPIDAVGVARLIEESSRLAGDGEKLQIDFVILQDILIEANYWAVKDGRKSTTHADVKKALNLRDQRASQIRLQFQEGVLRDVHMVETDGAVIGQINGLSITHIGDYAFGRPNKITARVRMGSGRVVDIEREVELGGPLHSKGVMILWGYLAGIYAQNVPLALSASLVFEQSYGGIDGDSASAAELFALLSSLAQVPIRQGIAVTGSINQLGDVQAIGGVNEKIEGFFDICNERGLTGDQGVIIPYANRVHLMLREDVVAACGRGDFHVWSIRHVNEGLEILTGIKSGKRTRKGGFETGSFNRGVEDRLVDFAHMRRAYNEGFSS